jgi:hypothetical protein
MAPTSSKPTKTPRDNPAGRPLSPPTKQSLITDYFKHRDAYKPSLLKAGAAWAIRRSSSCEDLSYRRSRWLVNRVLNATSHTRIKTTLTSTFPLQHSRPTSSPFKSTSRVTKPRKPARKSHIKLLGSLHAHTTLTAHQAAISSSPLLSLPGEIRSMIWEYAMTVSSGCLHYSTSEGRFDVSGIGAGLLTSCHLVALETTLLPLRPNTLVFEPPKRP